MKTFYWDSSSAALKPELADAANIATQGWLLVAQGVTHIVLYVPIGNLSPGGVHMGDSAAAINYITRLNAFLMDNNLPIIPVYVQLLQEWVEILSDSDPASALYAEAVFQAVEFMKAVHYSFDKGTDYDLQFGGWYVEDEPAAGRAKGVRKILDLLSPFDSRPTCVALNFLFKTLPDWKRPVTPDRPVYWSDLPISLWFYDEYPVRRTLSQYQNDEFSGDLAAPYANYNLFVADVLAAHPTAEVGFVVQAWGLEAERDFALGITPTARTKVADPGINEVRGLGMLSPLLGSRVVGVWSHYDNDNSRLGRVYAPNTQELSRSLTPVTGYVPVDAPPVHVVTFNPVDDWPAPALHLPTIDYFQIDVRRADGHWDPVPLWVPLVPPSVSVKVTFTPVTGTPGSYVPNDGTFSSGSSALLGGTFSVTGFLPGDLEIRVSVSKNSTLVGAWLRFQFTVLLETWFVDAVQRVDQSDPHMPGYVAPWDGNTQQHYVYFDLTHFRAGTARDSGGALALRGPAGSPTGLILFANCTPFSDGSLPKSNDDRVWLRDRANYPTSDATSGHNFGLYMRIFRNAVVSDDTNPCWVVIENLSCYVVPVPNLILLGIAGTDLGFIAGPPLFAADLLYRVVLSRPNLTWSGLGPTATVQLGPSAGAFIHPYRAMLVRLTYSLLP